MNNVLIRPMQASDKAFIMASWLRGAYYGNVEMRSMDKAAFFKHYAGFIENRLKEPWTVVRVACLENEPDVILGYAVASKTEIAETPHTLHWAFTKLPWRQKGIQSLIVQPWAIQSVTSATRPGSAIAKKRGWTYNPFL